MSKVSHLAKRVFDVFAATTAIMLLLPLLIFLTLLIRIRIGTPVLFRQNRVGLNGRIFQMLKFRTMTDGRDAAGQLLPDDQRMTPLGQLLRSNSLDELPELINVIRGEMSLVGPRPLLVQYLDLYTPEQMRRHAVRPGVTGYAQINGRNLVDWNTRFKMDVWYVDNQSLLLDCKIIFATATKVLKREGVSPLNTVTMPEFQGSSRTHVAE
jgi:sugar transferase EpsL